MGGKPVGKDAGLTSRDSMTDDVEGEGEKDALLRCSGCKSKRGKMKPS